MGNAKWGNAKWKWGKAKWNIHLSQYNKRPAAAFSCVLCETESSRVPLLTLPHQKNVAAGKAGGIMEDESSPQQITFSHEARKTMLNLAVGPPVNVSRLADCQAEVTIAIDPTLTTSLFEAFM